MSGSQSQQHNLGRGGVFDQEGSSSSYDQHHSSSSHYDMMQAMQQQQQQQQYQQQKLQATPQAMQQSYIDQESYVNQQSMLSGRFGPPSQATESFRNMTVNQQTPLINKQQYQQNPMNQFTPQHHSNANTERAEISQGFNIQNIHHSDTLSSQKAQTQQPNYQSMAPNNFLQELIKLQSQQQMLPPQNPIPQMNQTQAAPIFGQGFFNAASILANLQQLQQPMHQQTSQNFMNEKQGSTPQQQYQMQQPSMGNQGMSQMLNSNLNQYQQFIDQIEKQGMLTQQTTPLSIVSQAHLPLLSSTFSSQSLTNAQQMRPQSSQVTSPNQAYPFNGMSHQNMVTQQHSSQSNQSLNSSLLPSQSDMIRGLSLKQTSTQNYNDSLLEPQEQSLTNPYLMNQNRMKIDASHKQLIDYENALRKDESYQQNTVSAKERAPYNPNAYSAYSQYDGGQESKARPSHMNDTNFDDQYFQQRSPPEVSGRKMQPDVSQTNKRFDGGSPGVSWVSNNNGKQKAEPLSYLNNYEPRGVDGMSGSPLISSTNRLPEVSLQQPVFDIHNEHENSFHRNSNQQQQQSSYIQNNSQNSSSILQEQHMNNQGVNHRQNQIQYSPTESYRYDENQQNDGNSSMNFVKAQKLTQVRNSDNGNNPINIDDIPIGGGRPKTFEELLEENLRKMGEDPTTQGQQQQQYEQQQQPFNKEEEPKKEFLKRKTQKAQVGAPAKKYNYYVDNFEETKKRDQRSNSQINDKSGTLGGFLKGEDTTSYELSKQASLDQTLVQHTTQFRAVSPLDTTDRSGDIMTSNQEKGKRGAKKTFLTRGSGTAGGKQGHPLPKQTKGNKKSKQANQLLSDDEYPNDYNFAAEQDNKSPKPQNQSYLQRQTAAALNNKKNLENDLNRDSIAEFEKLEQEVSKSVINNRSGVRSPKNNSQQPSQQYSTKQSESQRPIAVASKGRKKKLFDDSDSNDEDDEDYTASGAADETGSRSNVEEVKTGSSKNVVESEELPNKSSVVKKFFYKEDPQKNVKTPSINSNNRQTPSEIQSVGASEQLEKAMKQKMDQLDKAIEAYNQQSEIANKLKREYENMIGKQRIEFRDFESRKKKEIEDIDKLKVEELEKLKKDRKLLEQKQRNLQLVSTSNKKEREEIEFLKKEVQRVQEEAKAKELKQKSQIDRLTKQVDEYKIKNNELNDELKHVIDQRRVAQPVIQKQGTQSQSQQNLLLQQQNRYTFSSNQNKSLEQLQPQQPKSILKNKGEEPRPVSASNFYNPDTRNGDDDEEEDENDYQDEMNGGGDVISSDNIQQNYDETSEQEEDRASEVVQRYQPQSNHDNNKVIPTREEAKHQHNTSVHQQPQNPLPPIGNTEDDAEEFDMKFPQYYHNKTSVNMKVIEQIIGQDGKIQRVYENGKKEVIFNNGVKREVFPDGYTIVYFNNSDIKQTYADQKVVYYFAEARTTQTTFSDGLQVFKFANNQIEKHFPDGTKEIIFPDGTIKCIFADGEEESIFPDGTIQRIEKNGVKAIEFANGQKDILFPDGTRIREYPDGRVRKTFPDGTQENSYREQ